MADNTDAALDEAEIGVITVALETLVDAAGGPAHLIEPRGYPHLSLVIIDAVWSLRTHYNAVENVLTNFCDNSSLDWEDRFESARPRGVSLLLRTLDGLTTDERVALFGNKQYAPGTRRRKADVVVDVANAFRDVEVEHCSDLNKAAAEWAARSVPGVGLAAWRYMLNLSGSQVVKPDTMVIGWISARLGRSVDPKTAAALLEKAAERICIKSRTADHLVWRRQSGRSLGSG